MARTTRTITFDTERDADLLTWLDAQKNVSQAVRDVLRASIAYHRQETTIDQVYHAVLDLSAKVEAGAIVRVESETHDGDAPGTEAAALALDNLGL